MIHRPAPYAYALVVSLLIAPLPAMAQQEAVTSIKTVRVLKVSELGDTTLHCAALAKEASAMRDIIIAKQGIEEDSAMKSRGIGAAGAVGSLLLGTLTAGVGLAAAGFLATEAVESEADQADSIKEVAAQRRSFMVGIYNAKGCQGPINYVMRPADIKRAAPAQPITGNAQPRTAGTMPSAASPAAIAPAGYGDASAKPTFSFND